MGKVLLLCLKISFGIVNVFLLVNFIVILMTTVLVNFGPVKFKELDGSAPFFPNVADKTAGSLIVLACVVTIGSAIFGLFTLCITRPKLLYIFVGCMVLSIVLGLIATIAMVMSLPELEVVEQNMLNSFSKATKDNNNPDRKHWQLFQRLHPCCGLVGPGDYDVSDSLLLSCCIRGYSDAECLAKKTFNKEGCLNSFVDALRYTGNVLTAFGVFQILYEVIPIVLALFLVHVIKKSEQPEEPEEPIDDT